MASTKKSLTARVAAGFGAVALATLTAFAGALPASAAPNLDPADVGTLTIHKYDQPAQAGTVGTGAADDAVPAGANPLDGVEFSVYRVTSIDLETNGGWLAADGLEASDVLEDDLDFVGSQTTGANSATGTAVFENLPLGLYLVRETGLGSNNIAIPAPDFIVAMPLPVDNAWNYDVHVFPKNPVGSIDKQVVAGDTQVLGEAVSWQIDNTVPYTHGDYAIDAYSVVDQYDVRLAYVEDSVAVTLGGAAIDEDLYEVLHDADARTVTVRFLTEGVTLLNGADGQTVRVTLETTVESVGDGAIVNNATLWVNGNNVDSDADTTHWGTLRILKHAGDDRSDLLSDATFELRTVADDASTTVASGTTNANGELIIDGVITAADGVEYFLVETGAPLGYRLLDEAVPVTIQPGQPSETQNLVIVSNEQIPGYELPVTGGTGQAAFMIGGAGLLLGALGFMLIRRRKAKADAQA